MVAPVGNKFWEKRTKHGRDKLFSSPEILWEECVGYFQWNQDNPLEAAELVKYQGEAKIKYLPKLRAMTIGGLCIHLGISVNAWHTYKTKEGYEDFYDVITQAEEIIRRQKFEGAAGEMLNPNIIARDLGLKDKSEVKSVLTQIVIDKDDYKAIRKQMLEEDDC